MELANFSSDGFSLFLDGNFEDPELWKECCILHDIAYWRGGSKKRREEADEAFKHCLKKKTGNPQLAAWMFQAVRSGGEPFFPTWYRWGYGLPLVRGYHELSPVEEEVVAEKLRKYWND